MASYWYHLGNIIYNYVVQSLYLKAFLKFEFKKTSIRTPIHKLVVRLFNYIFRSFSVRLRTVLINFMYLPYFVLSFYCHATIGYTFFSLNFKQFIHYLSLISPKLINKKIIFIIKRNLIALLLFFENIQFL